MYTREFRTEVVKGRNNYPVIKGEVFRPERIEDIIATVSNIKKPILARGGGTSYGDSSINNDGVNINTQRLNKMLHYDPQNGILHCQAGVTMQDIIRTFITKGWFLNVTPGTQYATVGGCIASDAHGKNWKEGSFCNFIKGLHLMLHDGSIIYCDDKNNSDIFYSTFGGMGMTGIILDAQIQLRKITSSFIDLETIRFRSLKECFDLQFESMESYEYLFLWLDSHKEGKNMGRGILQRATHCNNENLYYHDKWRIHVPFFLPNFTVNKYSVRIFNECYYSQTRKKNNKKVYLMNFFYPLDCIDSWYRVYGKKGFIEYQIVIPFENAYETIFELLKIISRSKLGSTVAAVKPLINTKGVMSFPMDGVTLAVDFLNNQRLWQLLDTLDEIVIANGGRVYLAKDARLSAKNFRKMYSESLDRWESIRAKYNPEKRFSSMMFNRFYQG